MGARRRDRLSEALGALDLTLTPDDQAAIEQAVPKGAAVNRPGICRDVKWFLLKQLPDRLTHATQVALQALQARDTS